MFSLVRPSATRITTFLAGQSAAEFSYAEVGATRTHAAPAGYTVDHNRIRLGAGAAVFRRAVTALGAWRMSMLGWVSVWPPATPPTPGATVAVVVRHYGFWSVNACRVIYTLETPSEDTAGVRRAGFAYGTLREHGEAGEERFTIEWHDADDSVWYDLYAFSRPGSLVTRVGHPLARRLQRRFARDSMAAMVAAVGGGGLNHTGA